jgi:hypothetical protein
VDNACQVIIEPSEWKLPNAGAVSIVRLGVTASLHNVVVGGGASGVFVVIVVIAQICGDERERLKTKAVSFFLMVVN